MSGVVLRCPNCGTTQATPGECEACHEAQVRYFCTNHTPGRWLEGAQCAHCGATFGEAPRPPRPAPPEAPGSARRPPASSRRPPPTFTPSPPPPPPSRAPRWTTARRSPPGDDGRRGPTLDEILREAARPRRIPPEAPPAPDFAPVVRGIGGCLVRAVLLGLFLLLALVVGLFVFGGALLQMFVPYY